MFYLQIYAFTFFPEGLFKNVKKQIVCISVPMNAKFPQNIICMTTGITFPKTLANSLPYGQPQHLYEPVYNKDSVLNQGKMMTDSVFLPCINIIKRTFTYPNFKKLLAPYTI